MSTTTFEHSPSNLEKKLATYWQLMDDRDQMLSRIAKAKNEKDSVNERIFQKVMADYEGLLEETNAQLEPLKVEMDALRQQTDQDIKQLEAAIEETEDELAEATFRHRVGEYDAGRLSEVKGRLEPRLKEAREVKAELQVRLKAMDRRRPAKSDDTAAAKPADASAAPSQATTVTPPAPAGQATQPAPAAQTSTVPEPAPVAPAASAPREPATAKKSSDDWDDPLAALSDPAPRAAASSAQPVSQTRTATAAPNYPNLLIRSGAHAGKIVPLLPMTMSIGREHDNNIELKDPEVARYHARILYEEGRFHVEDLDSSTGTWVNGQHQKRRPLSEGDVIRIGGTELVVEFA